MSNYQEFTVVYPKPPKTFLVARIERRSASSRTSRSMVCVCEHSSRWDSFASLSSVGPERRKDVGDLGNANTLRLGTPAWLGVYRANWFRVRPVVGYSPWPILFRWLYVPNPRNRLPLASPTPLKGAGSSHWTTATARHSAFSFGLRVLFPAASPFVSRLAYRDTENGSAYSTTCQGAI